MVNSIHRSNLASSETLELSICEGTEEKDTEDDARTHHNDVDSNNADCDELEKYQTCRLEDWERLYRSSHPNRLLSVNHLLTELNFGNLHLGKMPSAKFFQALPSLRYLWLQNNDLIQLNGELGAARRLLGLWLGNNRLCRLHQQIRWLHSLEVLDLSANELHDFEDITNELKSIHNLRELDLSGNAVTLKDHYESRILNQNTSLVWLDRKPVQPSALPQARNVMAKLTKPMLRQIGFGTHCSRRESDRKRGKMRTKTQNIPVTEYSPTLTELIQKRFDRKASVTIKHLDWASVPRKQERRENPPPDHAVFTIIKAKF